MKAQSSVYIKLQNIYKERARQDVGLVLDIARSITDDDKAIETAQVELFCKNARFIKLINSQQDKSVKLEKVVGKLQLQALSPKGWYHTKFCV